MQAESEPSTRSTARQNAVGENAGESKSSRRRSVTWLRCVCACEESSAAMHVLGAGSLGLLLASLAGRQNPVTLVLRDATRVAALAHPPRNGLIRLWRSGEAPMETRVACESPAMSGNAAIGLLVAATKAPDLVSAVESVQRWVSPCPLQPMSRAGR